MEQVTIRDIARKCKVGVSTVSRAMNNHPDINPETKEMILKAVSYTHLAAPCRKRREGKRCAGDRGSADPGKAASGSGQRGEGYPDLKRV